LQDQVVGRHWLRAAATNVVQQQGIKQALGESSHLVRKRD
jgi:hypothetical protein